MGLSGGYSYHAFQLTSQVPSYLAKPSHGALYPNHKGFLRPKGERRLMVGRGRGKGETEGQIVTGTLENQVERFLAGGR